MEMKVVTATSADEAAEIIIDLVEQLELPLPALFMIGVATLMRAADTVAGRSEEFKAMAINGIDERLPTEEKLVALVRIYLEYVQKCRSEGRCACGDPECKNNRAKGSSESSTSVH